MSRLGTMVGARLGNRLGKSFGLIALLLPGWLLVLPAAQPQNAGSVPVQPVPASAPSRSQASLAQASAPSASAAPASAAGPVSPELIGDSALARQHYQAAIAAYSRITEKTAAIWNKLGIAYQMLLNFNEAARCYQRSVRLDQKNPEVLNNLATVYGSLRDYGAANRAYRKALKIDPRSALIHKNYGTNLMTQHRYSEGWKEYKQAIAIDPTIFEQHGGPTIENSASLQERGAMNYYMALGCARAGYSDCAIEYLRNALDEGYTSPKKIAAESDFASLRGNPAFQQLLSEQRSQ